MQERLDINIIQYDISFSVKENIEKLKSKLVNLKKNSIVLLPEVFNTGFNFNLDEIDFSQIQISLELLQQKANEFDCLIFASSLIKEKNKIFNRLFVFSKYSNPQTYDKRHLFSLGLENKLLTKGTKTIIVEHNNIKILPLICYDLRFPVWSRNNSNYDVLIYISNWPIDRNSHWEALLRARAIENQCYVIGVNRIGIDQNRIKYIGNSSIYNYNGDKLFSSDNKEENIKYTIDIDEQKKYRTKFPFLLDIDNFNLD